MNKNKINITTITLAIVSVVLFAIIILLTNYAIRGGSSGDELTSLKNRIETLEEEKAELEGVNQDLRDSLADLRRKANDGENALKDQETEQEERENSESEDIQEETVSSSTLDEFDPRYEQAPSPDFNPAQEGFYNSVYYPGGGQHNFDDAVQRNYSIYFIGSDNRTDKKILTPSAYHPFAFRWWESGVGNPLVQAGISYDRQFQVYRQANGDQLNFEFTTIDWRDGELYFADVFTSSSGSLMPYEYKAPDEFRR